VPERGGSVYPLRWLFAHWVRSYKSGAAMPQSLILPRRMSQYITQSPIRL
jgi:hypothetical protein